MARQEGYRLAIKRCIDAGFAAGLLLGTAPVIALAALSIRATMGGPVLFRQLRPGKHGVPFTVYKFRTMRGGDDDDAQRLTSLGKLLRTTSIDELPQLVNVLLGQMSLVGPRPLLMEYLGRYSPEQARRHDVLPGITGWAQIHGRNALTHEQRFELDVWYVDHWSLGLDLSILAATAVNVLSRRGINAPGHVTMPLFLGTGESSGLDAKRQGTDAS